MMAENRISPALRATVALEKHGFTFTHSLGQNFILDDRFMEDLALMAGVGKDDCVLEIGPGPGILTSHLAAHGKNVLALEIDQKLKPVLADVLEGVENAEVVFEDCMKCDLPALLQQKFGDEMVHVVANLPYYITADVVERLLTCGANIGDITVMVQKEAAERIDAKVGQKNYCALAMLVQYYCDVEPLMDVSPDHFTPKPHVMSRLIKLNKREYGEFAQDEQFLIKVIKSAFRMRRKTLLNNFAQDFGLSRADGEKLLSELGYDARIRGEALSPEEMAKLSDALLNLLRENSMAE